MADSGHKDRLAYIQTVRVQSKCHLQEAIWHAVLTLNCCYSEQSYLAKCPYVTFLLVRCSLGWGFVLGCIANVTSGQKVLTVKSSLCFCVSSANGMEEQKTRWKKEQ